MESFAKSPFGRFIALAFVVSLFALAFALGGGNTSFTAPAWGDPVLGHSADGFLYTSSTDGKTLVIWEMDTSRGGGAPPTVQGSAAYTAK